MSEQSRLGRSWVIVSGAFVRHRGQDRANFELARHIAERGAEAVHVVASGGVEPSLERMPNVRIHRAPGLGPEFVSGIFLDRVGLRVARKVRARDASARIIVNGSNCDCSDVNWVHAVHRAWSATDRGAPALIRAKNRVVKCNSSRREADIISSSRIVFANSHQTRRHLVDGVGVPADRVHVVYLGTDAQVNTPVTPEERAAGRAWLGIEGDRLLVCFVGMLGYDANKGFDILLSAWQRLSADPAWDGLLVAAGGGRVPYWQRRIDAMNLGHRVRLLGHTPRVSELLAASDVLVSPTRYDSYGLAIQEALCREIPAIISARAGVSERFPRELEDLLLRNPEDDAALADRLRLWRSHRQIYQPHLAGLGDELRLPNLEVMARKMVERIEATPVLL